MKIKKILFLSLTLLISAVFIFNITTGKKKNTTPPKEIQGAETQTQATPEIAETIPTGKFYAPILLYHHIALKRPQNSYFVSPEIFDEQMKWLKENGYQVISLDKFYEAASGKAKISLKPVVITFDDGYKDQYENGWPILKKYGFTATFYVKLNNINKGGMTWDQLKELNEAGNVIGSHSVNHNNMAKMGNEELMSELLVSKRTLEEKLGIKINHFCYPGGDYNNQVISATESAGYETATTTKHKVYHEIKNNNSFFTLPRVHIDDEMPTFIDWVQGKNLY